MLPSPTLKPHHRSRVVATIVGSIAGTLILFSWGCQNPFPERVEQAQQEVTQRWQEIAREPRPPVSYLEWSEATRKLERSNLKLREARETLRVADDNLRRLPRSFIPELNLNLFTSPTFKEVASGDLSSTYFQIGGLLDLPTPWRYRARALQTHLQRALALVELELLRRDLYTELYRVFRESSHLSRLQREQQAILTLGRESQSSAYLSQADALQRQIDQQWKDLDEAMVELLGDQSRRWRPGSTSGLPHFDYANQPPSLTGEDDFAALQITHTALQLVALEASRQGLLLSAWPHFSVLISAPPIYQSSSGNSSYLSLEDIRLSPFMAYSTDFRGTRKAAREQGKRRNQITRQRLDLAMQTLLTRLKDSTHILRETTAQRERIVSILDALPDNQPAPELREQIAELDQQIDELNLAFWTLDNRQW